jgi:hypothetical protein
VDGSVLVAELAVLVAAVVVAAALADPCDCNADTRFRMKACMACWGVCVPDVAEVPEVLEALEQPAAIEEVAVASVVVAAVPAAEVAAVVEVSAPD